MSDTRPARCDDAQCAKEATVYAAGALCWRVSEGRLEVLLIHRPRYDDWSWPKGKLDEGETLPQAAVREVREETGLVVRPGVPLPPVHYPLKNGFKHTSYWAAEIRGGKVSVDGQEVDRHMWTTPAKAHRKLTQASDRVPLAELERLFAQGQLSTWPFVVVRHAKAKPRSAWARAEGERPLAPTGVRQAGAVLPLLEVWAARKVVSSPWKRCYDTVAPYASHMGSKVRTKSALTEKNHERAPHKVRRLVERYLEGGEPLAVCTHRPVLPTIVESLGSHMARKALGRLPSADPWLSPGEVLVCHVNVAEAGVIVAVETHRPSYDFQ